MNPENHVNALMNCIADGIVIVDDAGYIRFVNPAAERLFNRTQEELTGSLLGYPVVSGEAAEIEIFHNDGHRIVAEMRVAETHWQGDACLLASIRDITDRKESEEEIRRELTITSILAELYVPLVNRSSRFDEMAEIVLEKAKELTGSVHGYVGEINPDTGDLICHTFTQMLGDVCRVSRNEGICFSRSEHGTFESLWGWSLNNKQPHFENNPSSHPSSKGTPPGHIPLERFLGVPVMGGNQLLGQIALANPEKDYTHHDLNAIRRLSEYFALSIQKKRAEKALRTSEERFRQLSDNIRDVFWLMELGPPRTILYVSNSCMELWGKSPQDVMDERDSFPAPVIERDEAKTLDAFEQFLLGESDFNEEYRIRRPDGAVRWMWDRAFPIHDDTGRVVRAGGLAQDITERKIQENRQEELLREIQHFAYIVSHDLRAPLANLKGFSDELEDSVEVLRPHVEKAMEDLDPEERDRVGEALNEDIGEAIGFIKSSVIRMDRLISSILKLSRFGRTELSLQRIDMYEVVERVLDSLAHRIGTHGVSVSVGNLPEAVADLTSMEQVLGNLLDNAVKYLHPDRSGWIRVSGWPQGDETVYQIADNGVGIEEEDLERVFQVFQRAGDRAEPGEGMGLAYVRAIIRRHGGRIWCESKPEQGSVFTFTISNRLSHKKHSRTASVK
jgi:PAS domain S-box-containing protein